MRDLRPLCLLSLTAVFACQELADPPQAPADTVEAPLRVPGPWDPPPETRAIAATQQVDVVDPPSVAPRGSCSSSNAFACSCTHPECTPAHPGTVELREHLLRRFPQLRNCGTYCCRQNSAQTSVPRLSVHAIGRAIDLCVALDGGDADNGQGDPVANWLVENAEFIGIQRVIWDKAYWNGERGFGLLSSSSLPHTDHLHVEVSVAGAGRQTAFFTTGAVNGTCEAHCDGTRAIQADCSSVECAAQGSTCLPGAPPTCSPPPPPEPAEAAHHPDAALPALTPLTEPLRLHLLAPQRLFDTRTDALSAGLLRGDGARTGPFSAEGLNTFDAWPAALPADAQAAFINLAAIAIADPGPGFITAFPAGSPVPDTSSVNFQPGAVRANGVPLPLGEGRGVAFDASAPVHAVADLSAAFTPTGDGLSTTATLRAWDSRAEGAPLAPGEVRPIDLPIPDEATGAALTVTAVPGEQAGFFTAFPCDAPRPEASLLNYSPGRPVANTAILPVQSGRICVYTLQEAHLILDLIGWTAPQAPLAYLPLRPTRLLDTRQPTSRYEGRLAARQVVRLPVQALPNAPESVWGVSINATAVGATEPGFLTAYPCTDTVPNVSSGNYSGDGDVVATNTLAALSPQGELCVFSSARVHLIVDLLGVWVHTDSSQPPPDTQGDLPVEGTDDMIDDGDPDPDPDAAADPDADDTGASDDADPTPGADADPIPGEDADGAAAPSGAAVNEGCAATGTPPRSGLPALAFAALLLAALLCRKC